MNRLLTHIIFLSSAAIPLAAQPTIGLCQEVLGSAGKSVENQGVIYSYTVGETITPALSGLGLVLSQGFHQPDLCSPSVGTDAPDEGLADWQIELFPNPTDGWLNVRFSAEKTGSLRAEIFDWTGREIRPTEPLAEPSGAVLDCGALPSGAYFLRLCDASRAASATFRFVKI